MAEPVETSERALPLRIVLVSTIVALAAAIIVYQVLGGGDDESSTDQAGDVSLTPTGDPLPADELAEVTFQDLGGTTSSIGDLRGTPVVLNFFASWCVPCKTEMPAVERVHQDLGDEVTILGLAVRDRPEDVFATVEDTGVTYRIGRDVDDHVLTALGALGPMPVTALLDADGEVVEVHHGELSEDELRSLIDERLGVS